MSSYSILVLLLWLSPAASPIPFTEKIGIPIKKPAVLKFEGKIERAVTGNRDYQLDIDDESLLIFAKGEKSQPTTLFVRYGEERATYVAEIYPDDGAPTHLSIETTDNLEKEAAERDVFPPNIKQEYRDYGDRKDGVTVILTNVLHKGSDVYLRFFIDNTTTTQLKLSNFSFDYITFLRSFFFLKDKKKKPVNATIHPSRKNPSNKKVIELAAGKSNYFVFSIPYYCTNGGLDVYLGEADAKGERDFEFNVPNKILLQARREE
jgi:hypothetical protein